MQALKATVLDDNAFRLLAIPFGGPIPSPKSPRGVDLDGEWFDERTDIRVDGVIPVTVDVDWHHGKDPTGVMQRTVIGKAEYDGMDDDGHWVVVWLKAGERRLRLIKSLADMGAQLFGSSESIPGRVVKAATGHIDVWPYVRQTLSTSPQNTYSVIRPMKAAIGAPIHEAMRDLGADLRQTYQLAGGDDEAKARRVLGELQDRIRRLESI